MSVSTINFLFTQMIEELIILFFLFFQSGVFFCVEPDHCLTDYKRSAVQADNECVKASSNGIGCSGNVRECCFMCTGD